MTIFAVVIFPSEQRHNTLQALHDLVDPGSPCQIIMGSLYLIECDKGAPEIAQELGQRDPTDPDPPFVVEALHEGVLEDVKAMIERAIPRNPEAEAAIMKANLGLKRRSR